MRKATSLVALGVMAVGLVFVVFGTQIFTLAHALFVLPSSCASSCYPTTGIVYYTMAHAQTSPANYGLNFLGAGLAILGAIVFGATYPTKRLDRIRTYRLHYLLS